MKAVYTYALSDVRDTYLEASKAVLYYNIWKKIMRKQSLKYDAALKCSLTNNSFIHYKVSSAHGVNSMQKQCTHRYRKESI